MTARTREALTEAIEAAESEFPALVPRLKVVLRDLRRIVDQTGRPPADRSLIVPFRARGLYQDLTGSLRGTWRILGFLGPGKTSPWWLGRCRSCRHERAILGSQLRNAPPYCERCGAEGDR